MSTQLAAGDVLAVRSNGWQAALIRFGAAMRGQPNIANHIAVVSHQDAQGRWWCIEGKPGGVGWAQASSYLASPWTLNNCVQPGRNGPARLAVAAEAKQMLGTAYDWQAIADDTLRAFGMKDLWAGSWHGQAPGHVVCSSYAAFLYERAGWDHPATPDRDTTPADWVSFILAGRYNVALSP